MSIDYKKKYLKYKNKYYNLIQTKQKKPLKGGSGIDAFIYGTLVGSIMLLLYSAYTKYIDTSKDENIEIYNSMKPVASSKYEIASIPVEYSVPEISENSDIDPTKIVSFEKKDILRRNIEDLDEQINSVKARLDIIMNSVEEIKDTDENKEVKNEALLRINEMQEELYKLNAIIATNEEIDSDNIDTMNDRLSTLRSIKKNLDDNLNKNKAFESLSSILRNIEVDKIETVLKNLKKNISNSEPSPLDTSEFSLIDPPKSNPPGFFGRFLGETLTLSQKQPKEKVKEQKQTGETIINFDVNTIIKIEHKTTKDNIYGRVECNNNVQILTSKFNDLGLIKNEKYNTIPNTFTVTPTNMKIEHFHNLDNLDLTEVKKRGFSISDIKKLYVIHDERRVISVIKISTENEIEDQITIPDYQRKGLSTLLVDTLAKDIEEKDIQEKELYYIFTEHSHVKKMWETTKVFYSLDEKKSGNFNGLNNITYNLEKQYWVLRNNNCTTMYIFFNSGDTTFSENRENAIKELGDTIPRFNITSIDFENKKKIHNDTEEDLKNPNFNSEYMTDLFKNKFGEIKNAFITIMSHASDTNDDESKYRFGQDNNGFIYGTSFVNKVLGKSLYDNIVIYLATCYSHLLREYITRKKYPNIAIITGPLIAFGANYLSLNKSLHFIQDYNLQKSVKPFTMETALSHMLGNQLIILDNYEGLDEQTIEDKFRNEPFISILREWNQTKRHEIGLVDNIAIDTITNLLETKIKKYMSEINDFEVNLQQILRFIDESYDETKVIFPNSQILTDWYTSLKKFVQEFFENPDANGFVKGRIYVPDKLSQESADLFFCKNR